METLTIVLQEAPYLEGNKAWHALRLAGASLADGLTVRLFLLEKGVRWRGADAYRLKESPTSRTC